MQMLDTDTSLSSDSFVCRKAAKYITYFHGQNQETEVVSDLAKIA